MTKYSWAVKIATQLEKPRYVIFALQIMQKKYMSAVKTYFDHFKLTNIKLYLNSEFYPYNDLNLDFNKHRTIILICLYVSECLIIKPIHQPAKRY